MITGFEITDSRITGRQQGEEFKCYVIWQMMIGMLHSYEQQRTETHRKDDFGCATCFCMHTKNHISFHSIICDMNTATVNVNITQWYNQGRRSHRSGGVMTPTFRGKGGRGTKLTLKTQR